MADVGVTEQFPAVLAADPPSGSLPLTKARHEAYARLRAINVPARTAAVECGGKLENGAQTKLEGNRGIQARIAWLIRQDEDLLREKRKRLEAWLWGVMETNYADYWSDDGRSLRPFSELSTDQQMLIESLKFTEKGKPILSVYSKMQANIELRKMNGIGAAVRGGDDDLSRMPETELFSELQRLATELRMPVKLTMDLGNEAP